MKRRPTSLARPMKNSGFSYPGSWTARTKSVTQHQIRKQDPIDAHSDRAPAPAKSAANVTIAAIMGLHLCLCRSGAGSHRQPQRHHP